jgi:hypothetical protein
MQDIGQLRFILLLAKTVDFVRSGRRRAASQSS